MLSLLRQGLSVEREFGTHSLTTLLSVGELVEQCVYERGSLAPTPTGLAFRLNNPPLRAGAFSSARLFVDRRPVPAEQTRVRSDPNDPWRTVAEFSAQRPWLLGPGEPVEVSADLILPTDTKQCTVRMELQSTAIPPLVWLEFTDALRRRDGP